MTFAARFVRPGVALSDGEIINDDGLRSRFPRAGIVRGVSLHQTVASSDEGAKLVAAQTKKLIDAGCVISKVEPPASNFLDCGTWQARVLYIDANNTAYVNADTPTSPDCAKR
ncbi:MAG: hypothetical protein ABI183_16625 [Polyangiaceae bacterium]